MKITAIRHFWPEPAHFVISRPSGAGEYVFIHFLNPVEILYKGNHITTDANTCIVYSPSEPTWFCSHEPLVHNWMHITGNVTHHMSLYGLTPDTLYSLTDSVFVTSIVRELELEYNANRTYFGELTDLKIQELFLKISRNAVDKPPAAGIRTELAERFAGLRQEMFMNLDKEWPVSRMAAKVFLSEPHFYSLYKQLYGISPTQDLIAARMERAKNLLLQGQYKVSEIAAMLGYAGEYHFINQFRKSEGVSPGKYMSSLQQRQLDKSE